MKRQSARCFVQAPGASPWSKVPHVASTGVEEVEQYPAGPARDVANHVREQVNDDSPDLSVAGRSPVSAVPLLPRPCCLFSCRRTTPGYSSVKADLPDIAEKAVSSLIKTQGIGDLYRLYAIAKRDRIDYNYIDIPTDFTVEAKSPFDNKFMRALYANGYEMGRNGVEWKKLPPGFPAPPRSRRQRRRAGARHDCLARRPTVDRWLAA
jgi:hypothetical protein